ncbi:MAG: peptidyl-prolyl cis-trans isomerase, partial [Flavobacteriaceae bacterium]|nr:peptidyl-prolyl cis-trans isomerase [Flavobacteriaceae bacterium]
MNKLIIFLFSFLFVACNFFKQDNEKLPIARVNDTYLYFDDIKELVAQTASKEDSLLIISNFINRWATQQLLIDQSKINLPQERQDAFDELVNDYKVDLYTEAYKGSIVSRQLDSTVTQGQLQSFYDTNKENFKLNGELLKVRYIQVDENFSNLSRVKEKLNRFNEEDKSSLNDLSIQFKSFNFNDSIWVKKEALIEVLPVLKNKSRQVLKKSNFTQLQDSLGVYLVKIE